MASNEEVAAQLSMEQKARLDEVMKKAELLSVVSEEVLDQSRAVVAKNEGLDKQTAAANLQIFTMPGYLNNSTRGTLSTAMDMQHQYAGYIVVDYPELLDSGRGASFTMAGNANIAAAVVYMGKNNRGDADCGWLLGFRAKGAGQVYAVCGPMVGFIDLDWDDIKIKIERSGQSSYYNDQKTGAQINAAIYNGSSGYSVAVSFYG